jgi:hypothetical protein
MAHEESLNTYANAESVYRQGMQAIWIKKVYGNEQLMYEFG